MWEGDVNLLGVDNGGTEVSSLFRRIKSGTHLGHCLAIVQSDKNAVGTAKIKVSSKVCRNRL